MTSVLTLMAPAGRTLQINCTVEAGDEPGVCETPRERSRGGAGYSAVAEFAGAEAARDAVVDTANGATAGPVANALGGGRLLLRAGSNSARSDGG